MKGQTMEVFKENWARWAEYLWYIILAAAGLLELAGFFFAPVPTLSDLIVSLVRRFGLFGRVSVSAVCLWLLYHFAFEPFRVWLRQ
jgi:hypothetical protein